jgi:hypothetical protein
VDTYVHVRLARVVFTVTGAWGLIVLTPLYFLLDRVGREFPPRGACS